MNDTTITIAYTSGRSVNVILYQPDLSAWNPSTPAFDALTAANWGQHLLAMSEPNALGNYKLDLSTLAPALPANLLLIAKAYDGAAAGAAPISEPDGAFFWDGTKIVAAPALAALVPLSGAVNDAAPTASSFITNLGATDAYTGKILVWRAGTALAGQSEFVLSYSTSSRKITIARPFTGAPSNGDAFDLVVGTVPQPMVTSAVTLPGGSVSDATATTTSFVVASTDLNLTNALDWVDKVLLFTSGVNYKKWAHVVAFDTVAHKVTLLTGGGFSAAPANGDTFVLIGQMR